MHELTAWATTRSSSRHIGSAPMTAVRGLTQTGDQ
jgi:hypothetical protein